MQRAYYLLQCKRFVSSNPSITSIEAEHEEISIAELRIITIEFLDCSKLVSFPLVDGTYKHSLCLLPHHLIQLRPLEFGPQVSP